MKMNHECPFCFLALNVCFPLSLGLPAMHQLALLELYLMSKYALPLRAKYAITWHTASIKYAKPRKLNSTPLAVGIPIETPIRHNEQKYLLKFVQNWDYRVFFFFYDHLWTSGYSSLTSSESTLTYISSCGDCELSLLPIISSKYKFLNNQYS